MCVPSALSPLIYMYIYIYVCVRSTTPPAMQQAEVVSTSLVVLEPDLEVHMHMSQTVGTIYK